MSPATRPKCPVWTSHLRAPGEDHPGAAIASNASRAGYGIRQYPRINPPHPHSPLQLSVNRFSRDRTHGDPVPVPANYCCDCFMGASTTRTRRSVRTDSAARTAALNEMRSSRPEMGTWRRTALGLGVIGTEGSVIYAHPADAI